MKNNIFKTTLFTVNLNDKNFVMTLAVIFLLSYISPVFSATVSDKSMAWGAMAMQLFGGLALFLFGIEQMSDALKIVAGERMKAILAKLTINRFMGAATGAFVTAVIQSSTVTTVLVVGFISAGLMSLSQSVGIIMGANIGTTITAQIVAFKVTKIAFLMIGVGFTAMFVCDNDKFKQYGNILMGIGLVFFGMTIMGDAMKPLRDYPPFLELMTQMDTPLIGIIVAALFTGLIQSSSATTGIIIVMASQGFISLPAGIALAFGANIGTCLTAVLASIGKPREAVRAAMVHVFFNVAGVLIWFMFINQFAEYVALLSPSHPELNGLARLAAETPRQIANAHTIFNIANAFIFIGFSTQIARLVEKIIPDKPLEEENKIVKAKYLNEALLNTSFLALERVRLEVLHMGEVVQEMLNKIMPAILKGDQQALKTIRKMDDRVDILYQQIIAYMGKISKGTLTDLQSKEFLDLLAAVNDLENIGDTIETNLVELGQQRINAGFSISQPTRKVLVDFHAVIERALASSIQAVAQSNKKTAKLVVNMKAEISNLAHSAATHQAARLVAEEPNRIPAYTIEIDIIEKQKRIFYLTRRMAKSVMAMEPR